MIGSKIADLRMLSKYYVDRGKGIFSGSDNWLILSQYGRGGFEFWRRCRVHNVFDYGTIGRNSSQHVQRYTFPVMLGAMPIGEEGSFHGFGQWLILSQHAWKDRQAGYV